MTIYSPVVELFYGGAWHAVPVYARDPITITRGKTPESPNTPPATCTLTLADRDGLMNPKNPASPLWGVAGRNTPIRVTLSGNVRFVGEVSKWVPGRSVEPVGGTRGDAWVTVTAADVKRRLGQGADPLPSAFKRWMMDHAAHYWALDEAGAAHETVFKPTVGGPANVIYDPTFGVPGTFEPRAGKMPAWVEPGVAIGSGNQIRTAPNQFAYSGAGGYALVVAFNRPYRSDTSNTAFAVGTTDGVGFPIFVSVREDNQVQWQFMGNPSTLDAFPDVFDRGGPFLLYVSMQPNLGNTIIEVGVVDPTAPGGLRGFILENGTGLPPDIRQIYMHGGWAFPTGVAHLAVIPEATFALLPQWWAGNAGEVASARFTRLCGENGLNAYAAGVSLTPSPKMGPQYPGTLLQQMAEIEAVENGMVTDPRIDSGLCLISRGMMMAKNADLVLDYAAGQLAPTSDPVFDDLGVRNDLTLKRRDGGQFHIEDAASIALIGRVTDAPTINVAADTQLEREAHWRLHLATVDEMRWPQITVNYTANPGLFVADLSTRIRIINVPTTLAPWADVLVTGYTETITAATRRIVYQCTPYEPHRVGVYGSPSTRHGTSGCVTVGGFDAGTDTAVTVQNTGRSRWTLRASSWPFDVEIAGVIVRVTSVTGTGANQTLNVDAATVNGVIKSVPAGSPVQLAELSYYGPGSD